MSSGSSREIQQMVMWRHMQKTKNGVRRQKEIVSHSRAAELVKKGDWNGGS